MKKFTLFFTLIFTLLFFNLAHAEDNEDSQQKFENCVIKDFVSSHKNNIENCEFESLEISSNLSGSLKACKLAAWSYLKSQTIESSTSKFMALAEVTNKIKSMQLNTIEKINTEIQNAINICRQNGDLNYKEFKLEISPEGKILIHKSE